MRAKFVLTAALALLSISPANASSTSGAYVRGFETVGTQSSHLMYVFMDGVRLNGEPACSNSSIPNRWALDPTTPMGQATLSMLLTARATHETVTIYGYGGCELAGDAETIIFAATNNVMM